jgi:glucose-6-phosphate 1-dehydrogenase
VEIKTFSRLSFINAFHEVVGQYIIYREALAIIESDRIFYMAVPFDTYKEYGSELLVQRVFTNNKIKIIIYEPITQHIISWIK